MKKNMFYVLVVALAVVLVGCDNKQREIEKALEEVNKECPMYIDEGMTIVNVEADDNYIIYNVTVDDDIYDIASMRTFSEVLKHEMRKELVSAVGVGDLRDFVNEYDMGLKYIYKSSDEELEIVFTTSELKQILN